MIGNPAIHRLRHPAWLIFLLGGTLGAGLNMSLAGVLHRWAGWPETGAFFVGTLANQAFHYLYYRMVFVNQEVRFRSGPGGMLLGAVLLATIAAGLSWALMQGLGWGFWGAMTGTLALLSITHALLVRMATFSSATLAEVEYRDMGPTFYDDQTDPAKVNRLRALFHRGRFAALRRFVESQYKPGMRLADLGCGNCLWNVAGLPVIGVDINTRMMDHARSQGRLAECRHAETLTHLPLGTGECDRVILSEVLEHLLEPEQVLREIGRVMSREGKLLLTVPYDFFMGPFFVLFNINCLWQGYVRGSIYHRYRCGHVNHFNRRQLRRTLEAAGFKIEELFVVNGLTLYARVVKRDS